MKTTKLLFLLPLVVSLASCNTGKDITSGESSTTPTTSAPTTSAPTTSSPSTSTPTSSSDPTSSSSEPKPEPKGEKISVKLPAMMSSSLMVDAYYSDEDFDEKSNVMNDNLRVLSFAAACTTSSNPFFSSTLAISGIYLPFRDRIAILP